MDVILSSGYLAFARQVGFLSAVEEVGLTVDALVGTSSGALAGALWTAGHKADDVGKILSDRPISVLRPNPWAWDGPFHLDALVARLHTLLPKTFDELPRPFAVGVATQAGASTILTRGPLPEAVVASCAIPGLFAPIRIGDTIWVDGGPYDRTGYAHWVAFRGERPSIVHLVEPTKSGARGETGPHPVVHSKKTAGGLLTLGDFAAERAETRAAALAVLEAALASRA